MTFRFDIVSMKKVRPVVSKVWGTAKGYIMQTAGKPLVNNKGVDKMEVFLDRAASKIYVSLESLRDRQLPAEAKYLERELHRVRKRIDNQSLIQASESKSDVEIRSKTECCSPEKKEDTKTQCCSSEIKEDTKAACGKFNADTKPKC
ncbi:hypothetical protein SFRURICE_004736 [Spodoptera frugiperda]|nr:hypothetical protein SFRURICE_004736 [Spodoptera frugiperda]